MIPKTIHYCWFGRQPKPPGVLTYIATWRAAMPDYDIIEWNEDNFDIDFCDYSREAYATRNFAFVADVCRLKVLYEHGGIYLDTDIEVLRPFDPYLHHRSFCGFVLSDYRTNKIVLFPIFRIVLVFPAML